MTRFYIALLIFLVVALYGSCYLVYRHKSAEASPAQYRALLADPSTRAAVIQAVAEKGKLTRYKAERLELALAENNQEGSALAAAEAQLRKKYPAEMQEGENQASSLR